MKLVPFQFTNDYDKRSTVYVNPAFVISLRPTMTGREQADISLVSRGQLTVDGTIEVVSAQLCGDDQPEETARSAR